MRSVRLPTPRAVACAGHHQVRTRSRPWRHQLELGPRSTGGLLDDSTTALPPGAPVCRARHSTPVRGHSSSSHPRIHEASACRAQSSDSFDMKHTSRIRRAGKLHHSLDTSFRSDMHRGRRRFQAARHTAQSPAVHCRMAAWRECARRRQRSIAARLSEAHAYTTGRTNSVPWNTHRSSRSKEHRKKAGNEARKPASGSSTSRSSTSKLSVGASVGWIQRRSVS